MPRIQRRIGFELEFDNSRISLSFSQLKRKLETIVRRENHQISTNELDDVWTLKTDHCGFEFTSPAIKPTASNFVKIKRIIDGLKDVCREYRINNLPAYRNVCTPSCGMHVHIDVNDLNFNQLRNLINIFRTYENALLSIQAPSRSCNNFVYLLQDTYTSALLNRHSSIEDISDALRNHYCAVSFNRYNNRKTIEIRYASATVMGKKVVNWIQLLVCFIEIAKNMEENYQYQENKTVDHLKEFITTYKTKTWLDGRREALARWIGHRIEQIQEYQNNRAERIQNRNNNE